jgi:fatty-acyl-CoA synthase
VATRPAPAPGQAELPAPNAAALFRRNADLHATRPAVTAGDRTWTHAELYSEGCRWAGLLHDRLPPGQPPHLGVLLDNRPEYLFAFAGAALAGAAVVGLNHTRRGEHLRRDIEHADVGLVVTEAHHLELLGGVTEALPPVLMVDGDLEAALAEAPADDPGLEPDVGTTWALIFTSGTSSAPKAVVCSQRRILTTGARLAAIMGVGAGDIGYVSMPLFHSNSVMVGWAPALVTGASVALAPRFSASQWLPDVRRYGATYFNYTGKPLAYVVATPERDDDADNPVRVAFGNEGSPEVLEQFQRRFGVEVIDAFGATEGGVALDREPPLPRGSVGRATSQILIVDDDGVERPRARFDQRGGLLNAEDCVGEIVNTAGAGPFEGYYNNAEANERTLRNGWYWSGDLGYVDDDGYVYFAGRKGDWLRVDGENFPAGPIQAAIERHPDVVVAAVYGVPDAEAGDQAMAAVVLAPGASFDEAQFATWLDEQPDLGPKWRPRYVRVATTLPSTGTNKVLTRALARDKFRLDRMAGDDLWVRDRGAAAYRRFGAADEQALREALAANGRERFWDL